MKQILRVRIQYLIRVVVLVSAAMLLAFSTRPSKLRASSPGKGHIARSRTSTGPPIYLDESRELPVAYVGDTKATESLNTGEATPLSISSGDFNDDGIDDLLIGYGTSQGGVIAIHHGNLDAFAPQSKESFEAIGRGDFPPPFLPSARVFAVPVRPDIVAEGTFNPYGYRDLIIASRGDHSIYLLSNDGKGTFSDDDKGQWAVFFHELIERARNIPGVTGAAGVTPLPLGDSMFLTKFSIEGHASTNPAEQSTASYASATPDYFRVMGIRVLRGRAFSEGDKLNTEPVAVINESMARRFWADQEPLGKRIILEESATNKRALLIVGVVSDVRQRLRTDPVPQIYQPYFQRPGPSMCIVTRTESDPASATRALRTVITSLRKDQPAGSIATMDQHRSRQSGELRFYTILFSFFSAVAITVAGLGIYGVLSYVVRQRTHEIGVRMALGADRKNVLSMILRQGMNLTLIGVAIGLGGAYMLTKYLESLTTILYGVRPRDALTFALAAGLLMVIALLASFLPAQRATKVDPLAALRYE